MEGLGDKFRKAREARNLTLDEAARMTKIRPSKLAEIEAEDFSQFPSLAYARGFLLIYGKFLSVDVTPYLEAFETSEHVTVDGYSYLQDNPAPPPPRTEIIPRASRNSGGKRSSLMPLVIGIVVLIGGFTFMRLMMDLRRITPANDRDAQALAQTGSPGPAQAPAATAPAAIGSPALAVDATPAPTAIAAVSPPADPATNAPAGVAAATPMPTAAAELPPLDEDTEVRRAEPVNLEDIAKAQAALAAASATPSPTPATNRYEIRPLRKTYVRVVVDENTNGASFERWIDVPAGPVQVRGKRLAIKVLDPASVEIRKNGKVITRADTDVRLE
jgi:cytoskeletal protein RodZ